MDNIYSEMVQTLLNKIAGIAGFTNDISLLEGKMGIAIVLFHGSKYFSSEELEKVSESLISDIIEEEHKLYQLSSQKSSNIFWAFNYLSENRFFELDEDFFGDVDKVLLSNDENYSKMSVIHYPFLGNYILSRYRTSSNPEYWITQTQTYLQNMVKIINHNKGIYLKNVELLTPFWYTMLKWKEYKFDFELNNGNIKEICLFFENAIKESPQGAKQESCIQFYCAFKDLRFEFNKLNIMTISGINTIYLHKLLYPDFILPPNAQITESLAGIVKNKQILNELIGLVNFQNIGIAGYISGFAWSLLQYLQYS